MTENRTLLQSLKDPHGRVNCLEVIMTHTPEHQVCLTVTAVDLLPMLCGSQLSQALLLARSTFPPALDGCQQAASRKKKACLQELNSTREMAMAQVFLPSHFNTETGWKFWGCTICWGQKSNKESYSFSIINLANTWTLSHYLGGKKPPSIQWKHLPFYFQCFFFHTRLSFIPQLCHQGQFCLKFCN